MSSMSHCAPEQVDNQSKEEQDDDSVGSPTIRLKHLRENSKNLTKKGTNPQTIKSHNSTVSKKTGATKTGTGPAPALVDRT